MRGQEEKGKEKVQVRSLSLGVWSFKKQFRLGKEIITVSVRISGKREALSWVLSSSTAGNFKYLAVYLAWWGNERMRGQRGSGKVPRSIIVGGNVNSCEMLIPGFSWQLLCKLWWQLVVGRTESLKSPVTTAITWAIPGGRPLWILYFFSYSFNKVRVLWTFFFLWGRR